MNNPNVISGIIGIDIGKGIAAINSIIGDKGAYDSAAMQKAIGRIENAQEEIQQAIKNLQQINLGKLAGATKSAMESLIHSNERTLSNTKKNLSTCTQAINGKIKAIG